MKDKRWIFSCNWVDELRDKQHIVIYTDEMTIRVGDSRGQQWYTRLQTEAWHKDCVEPRHKGYTEMMFWGCYTSEIKGPCYIFEKESADEKKLASQDLDNRNATYLVEQQLIGEHFEAEQQKKPLSRRLKRIPKPMGRMQERNKGLKGGVDWYRYQVFVLIPRLIPFIHDVIATYGHCYLVQDGAPGHVAWQQMGLLEIEGLTILPWPGNSPDLNQIEPCWYHLKQQISKQPFLEANKQAVKQAWLDGWERLDMEKMGGFCMKMVHRMERVIRVKGDNNFSA